MGASYSDEMKTAIEELDAEEESFAERLKDLMADRGLTQTDLGKMIGVGQSAISNMLNRNCRPQQRTAVRLATALDVPVESLWKESDHVK
jgi:transcriptional regulator with XRE-family HTH domain